MNQKRTLSLTKVYLMIQICIMLCFIYIDFSGKVSIKSNHVKYFGMLLCLLYTWWHSFLCIKTNKRNILILMGMTVTLISDYFLLIADTHYFFAMLTFNVAQLSYSAFLNCEEGFSELFSSYVIRILTASLILLVFWGIQITVDSFMIVVVHYFSCLIWNAIDGFRRSDIMLGIAFILFICCDICVGISNASMYLAWDKITLQKISIVASGFIWVFYFPSQILISLRSKVEKY